MKRLKIDKKKFYEEAKNISLVLAGCFVLALADALFIVPCNIVNGGVDSLGVIVNYFLEPIFNFNFTDIVIMGSQLILWLIGLAFLGKKFSFHTLLGTIAFPLFYSLLLRINLLDLIGLSEMYAKNTNPDGSLSLSLLMMAGLFGGLLSGAGVALSYLGDGSTGGFDVVSFIIARYSDMKEDLSGLIMDTSLILIGLISMRNWELALSGILSAFVCAFAIQFIYIYSNSFVIADILTDKEDLVLDFIHEKMGHGTTLIDAEGGYSRTKRKLIRVVIYRVEINDLKDFIASVDQDAFVGFTAAKAVNGNGFEPLRISKNAKKKILEKYDIDPKDLNSTGSGD
ncbi:MAG: YitT family protein [Bacilli bacterium]|jgi:uncharacterized membrane-anchored protein YitT (DUF2179 family)|nr:YitT family protein [Bacilli bacterium]MCH4210595.1 YitT family protein [Bacilli bacterium]MCH4228553.1 YitT family protein [Bacilli bacterium]MCH4277311.1 YitT family protein [Bacilli bacterium]MCI2055223.1 YitT family protein [Bacilli bacterium]